MLNYFFIPVIKNIHLLLNNYKIEGIYFLLWDNFIMSGAFAYTLPWVSPSSTIKVTSKLPLLGAEGLYSMWISSTSAFIASARAVAFFLYTCQDLLNEKKKCEHMHKQNVTVYTEVLKECHFSSYIFSWKQHFSENC